MQKAKNTVIELLGRRLRLGMVGGGIGSMIGEVHRTAARISDSCQLVAAVLSPDPESSHADGKALAIPRVYGGWQEMLEAEAQREDGVDVVTVMTPNDSHAEIAEAALRKGFHVLCEKPLTNSLQDAQILADCVAEMGKVFCVSFNYSMYAMVRQARALVRAGELGEIRQLHAEYIQGHNATLVEKASYNWRFDVSRGGPSMVMGAIASHAHHLLCSTVGLQVDKLLADLKGTVAGRKGHDYAALLLRMENGAPGSMWITNAASGGEHGLRMRIFGSKGALEWCQETPGNLVHRRAHGFTQTITPSALLAQAAARGESVHPGDRMVDAYQEAFGRLYGEVALAVAASLANKPCPAGVSFPTVEAGVENLRFTAAALESNASGGWAQLKR